MHKPLANLPVFNAADFRTRTAAWKGLPTAPGQDRVVIEWSTGTGPRCFAYPAADRARGVNLLEGAVQTQSDERWADFLEYELVPKIVAAVESEGGHRPQVICVDLRPLQVQRARRRTIEAAAKAKSGHDDTSLAAPVLRQEP